MFFLARTYKSNSIELGSYAVHVSVVLCLCALGLQETLAFLENRMKIHLDEILHFLMIVLTHILSFHYILGVYFFFIHFKLFSRGITKLVMFICSLMEKFFIKKWDWNFCWRQSYYSHGFLFGNLQRIIAYKNEKPIKHPISPNLIY